jgi:hypothetical protein
MRPAILYWRTSTGDEVDFVIEWQGNLLDLGGRACHTLVESHLIAARS